MRKPGHIEAYFAGFAFTLIWVSIRTFKRFGIIPCSLYVVCSVVLLYFFVIRLRILAHPAQRPRLIYLAAFTVSTLLLVGSLQMNSLINCNYFGNLGISYGNTDVDDAITLALDTCLSGEYPYKYKTSAGGSISPMPGALLLALPFHMMGNAAAQVVFWFSMLFIALMYLTQDARAALWLWLLAFFFSPKILEGQMFQGSDHLANATYVALVSILLVEVTRRHSRQWPSILGAVLFGITLSSRLNFLLILPVVYSALIRLSSWRKASALMCYALLSFSIVTGPFYVYAPDSFSPLHIASVITGTSPLIGFLSSIAILLAGGCSILLAMRPDNDNAMIVLRNCFVLQLWVVVSQLVFAAINGDGALRIWMFVQYGFFVFPFGFLFFGTRLCRSMKQAQSTM